MNLDAAAFVLSAARSVDVCNLHADAPDQVLKSCEIGGEAPVDIVN
jgi:hypothetical protein